MVYSTAQNGFNKTFIFDRIFSNFQTLDLFCWSQRKVKM